MAALRYKGINSLDLSLVARLVLENLVVRLLKGDPGEMLVTAHDLADEFGIERETVREAFGELSLFDFMPGSLPDYDDLGKTPTSVRLKALRVFVEPLFKDEQPKLGDEGEEIDAEFEVTENDRELSGWDHVQVGDLAYKATVQAGGEKGYLLNIDLIGGYRSGEDGEVYDPFSDNTPKVIDMEFGSCEECWTWFDAWVAPASKAGVWHGPGETVENGVWTITYMVTDGPNIAIEANGSQSDIWLVGDLQQGIDSIDYLWSWIATSFPKEATMQQFESDVREALAYALAQAVPAPSEEPPAPAPAAKRKRKAKGAVS